MKRPGGARLSNAYSASEHGRSNNPKSRRGGVLAQHGNAVDGDGVAAMKLSKCLLQQLEKLYALAPSKPGGQCHVEAKVFKYVWVAPLCQMLRLALAEPCAQPSRALVRAHRGAKAIEGAD